MTMQTVYEIPDGAEGTRATLDMMVKLAKDGAKSESVLTLVAAIQNVSGATLACTLVNALDAFVRQAYQFVPEDVETIKHPVVMIFEIETLGYCSGDCDDVSTLLASVIYAMGIPVRLVAIKGERDNPEFTHVYVEADCNFYWKRLDPTVTPRTIHKDYGKMVVNL